jgi:hypothetical protein
MFEYEIIIQIMKIIFKIKIDVSILRIATRIHHIIFKTFESKFFILEF